MSSTPGRDPGNSGRRVKLESSDEASLAGQLLTPCTVRNAEFRADHHRVEVTLDGCTVPVVAHSVEPFRGGDLVRATVRGPVHTLAT